MVIGGSSTALPSMHLQLASSVYTVLVDLTVKLGANEVDAAVVAESAPLSVDKHMLLFGARFIVEELCVLHCFDVAGVAAGAWVSGNGTVG